MFPHSPRGQGELALSHRPGDPAGPWLPPSPPTSRPPTVEAAPAPRPGLDEWLGDFANRESLKVADVVYAVDATTGQRCGLFFGDPEIEWQPIDPNDPFSWPAVVEVPVDRDGGDLETLAGWLEVTRGSCSFVADLRKELEDPEMVEGLANADLIYAVDGATGERCGLFFGDPEIEARPIPAVRPWLRPKVMEVRVNPLSDDREVLAEAVFGIKGECTYAMDLRKLVRDPDFVEGLWDADLIFAVDRATGERCGVFYGDPAKESLPLHPLQPSFRPGVTEVYVGSTGDDRAILAAAVGTSRARAATRWASRSRSKARADPASV
jgi:hypothetical protein